MERNRLRGIQDAWHAQRAAAKPAPKPKPRKINRDRRRRLVESTVETLKTGQPTHFAYEAACRHRLRSGFCRDGWTWRDADAPALDIVATALRFIGAKRPTWMEGQLEHTQEGFSPIERTRCVRCGGNMPDDDLQNGWERRYCSNMCRSSDWLKWEGVSGERRTRAEYWAAMAVTGEAKKLQRERPCQWCGTIHPAQHRRRHRPLFAKLRGEDERRATQDHEAMRGVRRAVSRQPPRRRQAVLLESLLE